jgi:hypothetical protein
VTRIYTPVEGYTGVVAGVPFTDGQADADHLTPSQLRYFRSQGYGIDQPPTVPGARPVVEHPAKVHVGTLLADASQWVAEMVTTRREVEAEPEFHDYRKAAADAAERRGDHELADALRADVTAEEVLARNDQSAPAEPSKRPNVRDSINAWRTWALTLPNVDPDAIAAMTKPELQALGNPEET